MKKLNELIEKLCPNGVEYKKLDELTSVITKGTTPTSIGYNFENNGVNFIKIESIDLNGNFDSSKFSYISDECNDKLERSKLEENDILFSIAGAIGRIAIVKKEILPANTNQALAIIRINSPKALVKYVSYILKTKEAKEKYMSKKVGAAQPNVSLKNMAELCIPVPPLEVQNQIVHIMDDFTELSTELSTELKARQKQFAYYREKLITELDGKIYKLDSVVDIYLGLTHTPKYVENGIKFISAQNTSKDYLDLENVKYISENEYKSITDNAKPKRNDILFTRVGSNLGHPVIVETDEELCIFVSLGFLRVKDVNKVSNRYIKHWINTEIFWKQVRKNVHGSAKVNLNTGWLKDFEIRIPSLEKQVEIVKQLDKLEKISNDIKIGLPAEIEARQKQYEYYRDKLLTFKELKINEE